MEFFGTYRLSRPPLVKDDLDPDGNTPVTPLRTRFSDAVVFVSALVGILVALTALDEDAPGEQVALGGGIVLLGFALAQLAFFFPEARAAWARGARRSVSVLALAGIVGAALITWGLSGY